MENAEKFDIFGAFLLHFFRCWITMWLVSGGKWYKMV